MRPIIRADKSSRSERLASAGIGVRHRRAGSLPEFPAPGAVQPFDRGRINEVREANG